MYCKNAVSICSLAAQSVALLCATRLEWPTVGGGAQMATVLRARLLGLMVDGEVQLSLTDEGCMVWPGHDSTIPSTPYHLSTKLTLPPYLATLPYFTKCTLPPYHATLPCLIATLPCPLTTTLVLPRPWVPFHTIHIWEGYATPPAKCQIAPTVRIPNAQKVIVPTLQ